MSNHQNPRPRLRRLGRLTALALTLVALLALASSGPLFSVGDHEGGSFESFFPGGPWRVATQQPACAMMGKVCAEWPSESNTVWFCCIDDDQVGTWFSPAEACDTILAVERL